MDIRRNCLSAQKRSCLQQRRFEGKLENTLTFKTIRKYRKNPFRPRFINRTHQFCIVRDAWQLKSCCSWPQLQPPQRNNKTRVSQKHPHGRWEDLGTGASVMASSGLQVCFCFFFLGVTTRTVKLSSPLPVSDRGTEARAGL